MNDDKYWSCVLKAMQTRGACSPRLGIEEFNDFYEISAINLKYSIKAFFNESTLDFSKSLLEERTQLEHIKNASSDKFSICDASFLHHFLKELYENRKKEYSKEIENIKNLFQESCKLDFCECLSTSQ
jgi:DNA repair protein RadC